MKKLILAIMVATTFCSCGNDISKTNPLLKEAKTPHGTPLFEEIKLDDYVPALDYALEIAQNDIKAIIENSAEPTFENTIVALERSGKELGKISDIFFPLTSVLASPQMDSLEMIMKTKIISYSNDVNLNPDLFKKVKAVYEKRETLTLDKEDNKLLENTYTNFVRGGADLDDTQKATYRKLTEELAQLNAKFGQNVLAETNSFSINIPLAESAKVAELPEFVREAMAAEAKERGQEGWTVTLQQASMIEFMTYSTNREIKESIWKAYNSRGMKGNEYDNRTVLKRITELRLELAKLMGYDNYAAYTLEERMAEDVTTVTNFLDELLKATISYAKKDVRTIEQYAKKSGIYGKNFKLMPWDWSYFIEKYKTEKYAVNDEEIKPYLELERVKQGIFMLAEKLYGIKFVENKEIQVYHPEVTAYDVFEENGDFTGVLYMDFFPRASKRPGAWMTSFGNMYTTADGKEVRPFITMSCNFTKPTENTPALLTFNEFETFLHEFGHCLHGLFAEGKYASLTGTSVYRDFVELPSQILENWATEKEFLDMFAVHYQTGEKMPQELINKIANSKNFLAAYFNIRQLSFGINDIAWHTITAPVTENVDAFEKRAIAGTAIMPDVAGTAFSPAFSHIFAGGYAAGYYSYKWAEVLEADAYSLFKEKGIFNREVAQSFRDNILSKGGIEHPMTLYINFRGHKPEVKALIDKMNLK